MFIVNSNEDKLSMVASCGNKAMDAGIKAGDIISKVCALANGKGGGKPDLAQGGGSNTEPEKVINEVENLINI